MQSLSRATEKLFGIQYLLCFLVLLLEMSFAQFLCAGTVSELDLGLTAKGASPFTAAEARSAKMAEELDLGIGPDLIPKHGGGGGGGGGGRGRGGWSRSLAVAQEDLRKHEAAEAADQAATDREMAEAKAMIADAERDMGGSVRSRGLRFAPEKNARIHNPAEGPHVRRVDPRSRKDTRGKVAWINNKPKPIPTSLVGLIRDRTETDIAIGLGETRIADLEDDVERLTDFGPRLDQGRRDRDSSFGWKARSNPDYRRRDPNFITDQVNNTIAHVLVTSALIPGSIAEKRRQIAAYGEELEALRARRRVLDLELKKMGVIPLH